MFWKLTKVFETVGDLRPAIQRDQRDVPQYIIDLVVIVVVVIEVSSEDHEQLRLGLGPVARQAARLARAAAVALLLRQRGTVTEEEAELVLAVERVVVAAIKVLALGLCL